MQALKEKLQVSKDALVRALLEGPSNQADQEAEEAPTPEILAERTKDNLTKATESGDLGRALSEPSSSLRAPGPATSAKRMNLSTWGHVADQMPDCVPEEKLQTERCLTGSLAIAADS